MHIQYDSLHENCLAVRIFPLDTQAHYVEITLLAYHVDGNRCWLPPEVRTRSLTRCGIREAAALKQATDMAASIVGLLQAVTDPQHALETMQGLPAAA